MDFDGRPAGPGLARPGRAHRGRAHRHSLRHERATRQGHQMLAHRARRPIPIASGYPPALEDGSKRAPPTSNVTLIEEAKRRTRPRWIAPARLTAGAAPYHRLKDGVPPRVRCPHDRSHVAFLLSRLRPRPLPAWACRAPRGPSSVACPPERPRPVRFPFPSPTPSIARSAATSRWSWPRRACARRKACGRRRSGTCSRTSAAASPPCARSSAWRRSASAAFPASTTPWWGHSTFSTPACS